MKTDVWIQEPVDRHLWAFYYFCKRKGDQVLMALRDDGTADLYVTRRVDR